MCGNWFPSSDTLSVSLYCNYPANILATFAFVTKSMQEKGPKQRSVGSLGRQAKAESLWRKVQVLGPFQKLGQRSNQTRLGNQRREARQEPNSWRIYDENITEETTFLGSVASTKFSVPVVSFVVFLSLILSMLPRSGMSKVCYNEAVRQKLGYANKKFHVCQRCVTANRKGRRRLRKD